MAAQFTFVPIDIRGKTNNYNLVTPKNRQIVRSLAARNPWNRPSEGDVAPLGTHGKDRRLTSRKKASAIDHKPLPKTSTNREDLSCASRNYHKTSRHNENLGTELDEKFKTTGKSQSSDSRSPKTPIYSVFEVSEPSILYPSGNANATENNYPVHIKSAKWDPFWTFPIQFRKFIPPLINHRMTTFHHFVPLLDDPDVRHEPSRWVMTRTFIDFRDSPAYLYATLLCTAAQIRTFTTNQKGHSDSEAESANLTLGNLELLLWLRNCAIQAINAELSDSNIFSQPRKLSTVLAAISMLATYEYNHGEAELQRLHLRGCCNLIQRLGGLDYLEEITRRFYVFVLRVALQSNPGDHHYPRKFPNEYNNIVYELRDVLEPAADKLGYDLNSWISATPQAVLDET